MAHDPAQDLREGFWYGGDALVEARLTVETVWLRSWQKPLMPRKVRDALGIAPDAPPADQPLDPNAPPDPNAPADPNAPLPTSP